MSHTWRNYSRVKLAYDLGHRWPICYHNPSASPKTTSKRNSKHFKTYATLQTLIPQERNQFSFDSSREKSIPQERNQRHWKAFPNIPDLDLNIDFSSRYVTPEGVLLATYLDWMFNKCRCLGDVLLCPPPGRQFFWLTKKGENSQQQRRQEAKEELHSTRTDNTLTLSLSLSLPPLSLSLSVRIHVSPCERPASDLKKRRTGVLIHLERNNR